MCRYALNIGFNLLNKSIFKYFPFPWTVSTVHVVVGLIYCVGMYALGFKKASFGRVCVQLQLLCPHASACMLAGCGLLRSMQQQSVTVQPTTKSCM